MLLVLAALAAYAIPSYFSRPESTLESAATALARDLRSAQNRAAWQDRLVAVCFPSDGDGYSVHVVDLAVPLPVEEAPIVLQRRYSSDAVYEGVVLELRSAGNARCVRFDPRGTALEGACIVLHFEGHERTLQLEPGSGMLSIPDSSSGWRDSGY